MMAVSGNSRERAAMVVVVPGMSLNAETRRLSSYGPSREGCCGLSRRGRGGSGRPGMVAAAGRLGGRGANPKVRAARPQRCLPVVRRDLAREVFDGGLDGRAEGGEGQDAGDRDQRGGDGVLRKLQAGLVTHEFLNHLSVPRSVSDVV